jgi:hypothetical protein
MVKIVAYSSPEEALRRLSLSGSSQNAARIILRKLMGKGWRANAFDNAQQLWINRSGGAESSYNVLMSGRTSNSFDVLFTDPRRDGNALRLGRDSVLIHRKFRDGAIRRFFGMQDSQKKASEIVNRILYESSFKPPNVYFAYLHSHWGSIRGKGIWDDGTTPYERAVQQLLLHNTDIFNLTSHNWPHDMERLRFLTELFAAFNVVFVPGFELTATIVDQAASPHLLVYCRDPEAAMELKDVLLIPKLLGGGLVTSTLRGPPPPIEKILEILDRFHKEGKIACIWAHPASTLPGIDLLDPVNVYRLRQKGIDPLKLMFEFGDGVEQYNASDRHRVLNLNWAEGKGGSKSDLADELREAFGIPSDELLTPANINYHSGIEAERRDKIAIWGPDDHFQDKLISILTGRANISSFAMGRTELELQVEDLMRMKNEGDKKFTAADVVEMMRTRRFPLTGNPVIFRAVAFAENTERGPEYVKARMPGPFEGAAQWLCAEPAYILGIAGKQLRYWLADPEERKVIENELKKAKARMMDRQVSGLGIMPW